MSPPKYKQVATTIREQIADGVLAPGMPVPSGAALSRATGYSVPTCRRALRTLITDGVLSPGTSRKARPRVPGPGDQQLPDAKRALSTALASHRRAAALTQPQLAELIGVSVTNVGHAETGRLWQSRQFWESADEILSADGELLHLHEAFRAAEVSPEEPADTEDSQLETDPTGQLGTVKVDVLGPVTCITITWLGGAVTTVYPPAGHKPRPVRANTLAGR